MKDYKKILEGVVNIINNTYKSDIGFDNICAYIGENCPELKESEDESMVKFIKNQLFNIKKTITENYELDAKLTKAICWLEKQCEHKIKTPEESLGIDSDTYNKIVDECIYGEQKPIDNVEPNFKVGDWVVYCNDDVDLITGIEENGYCINNSGYIPFICVSDIRLWTIQDAKDGDVLAWDDSKCIALFKNIYDEDSFNSHGFVGCCTGTFESRQSYHDIEGAHPATKEQRDHLFQKMHEAGYEWDAEKKELIKIEHKPAWSEKDNEIYRKCICAMRDSACGFPEEEKFVEQVDNWLKSIKDIYTWKPSEEQMKALKDALNDAICQYDFKGSLIKEEVTRKHAETIESLYNDLKKL